MLLLIEKQGFLKGAEENTFLKKSKKNLRKSGVKFKTKWENNINFLLNS